MTILPICSSVLVQSSLAYANPDDEISLVLRDYNKLAPLGKVADAPIHGKILELPPKRIGLPPLSWSIIGVYKSEVRSLISGVIDDSLFPDDCKFVESMNRVNSVSQYSNALKTLFDQSQAEVQLVAFHVGKLWQPTFGRGGFGSNRGNGGVFVLGWWLMIITARVV